MGQKFGRKFVCGHVATTYAPPPIALLGYEQRRQF